MTKTIIHFTELCLAYTIGILYGGDAPKGRLKNLFTRLIRETSKDLAGIRKITDAERRRAAGLVHELCVETGWIGTEKHAATAVSFCLMILELSDFDFNPGIISALNDIYDYFERAKKVPAPSAWAGDLAAQKWARILEEIETGERPVPVLMEVN